MEFLFRKNGKIVLGNNVKIDNQVRLLTANNSKLLINSFTKVGKGTVINAGADVIIGKNCLISGYCYIQSSSHGFKKKRKINKQKHSYGKIFINDDVWLGAHSTILPKVSLGKGCVIGSNSVVNKNTDEFFIYAGSPAKKLKKRK